MLVTEKCIFLHMPKTGGHYCRDVLREFCGEVLHRGGWHAPFSRVPEQYRDLPIIIAVRNPWDWYVSWYHYMVDMLDGGHPNPLIVNASMHVELEFNAVMSYVFKSIRKGTKEAKQLNAYLKSDMHMFSKSQRPGIRDLDVQMIERMNLKQYGVLSWRFDTLLQGADIKNVHFCEFESLSQELVNVLGIIGVEVSDSQKVEILNSRKVNVGATRAEKAYKDFYKGEGLKRAIAFFEKSIIKKFEYSF